MYRRLLLQSIVVHPFSYTALHQCTLQYQTVYTVPDWLKHHKLHYSVPFLANLFLTQWYYYWVGWETALSHEKQQFCCKTVKECKSPTEPGEILNCAARPRIPPFYYQLLQLRTLIDNTNNAKCWSISQLSRSSKDTDSLRQWGNVVNLVDWMNWRNQMLEEGFCATPFSACWVGPLVWFMQVLDCIMW